jgi:hypothetical protein
MMTLHEPAGGQLISIKKYILWPWQWQWQRQRQWQWQGQWQRKFQEKGAVWRWLGGSGWDEGLFESALE